MWISRQKWNLLQAQLEFAVNTIVEIRKALAQIDMKASRIEWRTKAIQADANSDWADDNRRTQVRPISGDQ